MTETANKELVKDYGKKIKSRGDLDAVKRLFCKKYKTNSILNSDIWRAYQDLLENGLIKANPVLEQILKKRSIRTMSGIAPVAVLTKPYPCPGSCAYCPRESEDVPVSYLSNEPAVMRAIRCAYDPYVQVALRLKALETNGHSPKKIEIIVIGGTWSYLPEKYKYWYILNCFKAANDFNIVRKKIKTNYNEGLEKEAHLFKNELKAVYKENLSLENLKKKLAFEQKKNEKAEYKIIGLTLETRPDYINKKELEEMRILGCTRVEIGVQAVDDEILKINKRGHGVKEIAEATKSLKEYGFKITYHLMPALPGATPKKDLEIFKKLFTDERFQPDQIKFYPTVVTKGSLLYKWFLAGKYKPYSDKVLQDLIVKCKEVVPKYVRIIRLIRDIPGESIIAGNKITNLRQVLKDRGVVCNCIRCREVKDGKILKHQLNIETYPASSGREYFISIDGLDGKTLYGFCRLRVDKNSPVAEAIIRELHVYGELVPAGDLTLKSSKTNKKVQHLGLGKELMKKAEEIARKDGAKNLAVISGVGVRGYYRKLGYRLKNTYLLKSLD
ncbi:tRNA uridine(34) 5-carboxymethylaminomethyl modification radical SAM/GNAT enzyme Elp3 [Patescibacteria group bacterium]|nr:tRNA uridine(34) 5-carboxymethylaminomethyl modification radical SAM/GNAT enzyme Elp3 [Patescibacteria group bacterium]